MKKLTDVRFFWTFVKPHQLLFVTGLISVVAVVLCILQMGQSLRILIQSSDLSAFLPGLWGLAFWVCILAVASFGRSYSFAVLAERVVNDLKQAIFTNLMRLEMSFYDQQGAGEILSRFHKDTDTIQHFFSGPLGTAVRNLLMFVGGTVLLLQTSWSLTLVALATLPFIFIPIIICLRFYRRHSQRTLAAQEVEAHYVSESIHNIRLVQAFSYGHRALAHWLELLAEAENSAQKRYRARAWASSSIIMLVSLSIAGVLTAGVYSVHAGHMTPGQLAAFLFYAVVVAATASSFTEILADWQRVLVSRSRLEPLLDATPQRRPVYRPLPSVAGIIAVHHVNFAYPHQMSQPILSDVTL
ncbi:MAG: ABC transporter transmembrane domain-containing protein, partial [Alphaproteobacteria bacterium]